MVAIPVEHAVEWTKLFSRASDGSQMSLPVVGLACVTDVAIPKPKMPARK
jgi:hypothetical protein